MSPFFKVARLPGIVDRDESVGRMVVRECLGLAPGIAVNVPHLASREGIAADRGHAVLDNLPDQAFIPRE